MNLDNVFQRLKECLIFIFNYCLFRLNIAVLLSAIVVLFLVIFGLIDVDFAGLFRIVLALIFLLLFLNKKHVRLFYEKFAIFIEMVIKVGFIRVIFTLCLSLYSFFIQSYTRTSLLLAFLSYFLMYLSANAICDKSTIIISCLIFAICLNLAAAVIRSIDIDDSHITNIMRRYLLSKFVFGATEYDFERGIVFNWLNLYFLYFFLGEVNKRDVFGGSKKLSNSSSFHSSAPSRYPLQFLRPFLTKVSTQLETPTAKRVLVVGGAVGTIGSILWAGIAIKYTAQMNEQHKMAIEVGEMQKTTQQLQQEVAAAQKKAAAAQQEAAAAQKKAAESTIRLNKAQERNVNAQTKFIDRFGVNRKKD